MPSGGTHFTQIFCLNFIVIIQLCRRLSERQNNGHMTCAPCILCFCHTTRIGKCMDGHNGSLRNSTSFNRVLQHAFQMSSVEFMTDGIRNPSWVKYCQCLCKWAIQRRLADNFLHNSKLISSVLNGNLMNFSQTDRICFPNTNWIQNHIGHQNPPKFSLAHVGSRPYLTQLSLATPHSPHQMAAKSLHAIPHSNATYFWLVSMGCPIFTHKIVPSCGVISTFTHPVHPWTHHPKWHQNALGYFFHNDGRQIDRHRKCGKQHVPIGLRLML